MKKFIPIIFSLLLISSCVSKSDEIKNSDNNLNMTITRAENPVTTPTQQAQPTPKEKIKKSVNLNTQIKDISFAYHSQDIFCISVNSESDDNDYYEFLKENGDALNSEKYDFALPFNEDFACVMKDGKYGFIDTNGDEHIPLIYDRAASFSEGLAYFETEDKYGFINRNGEEVLILDCDSISSFKESRAFFTRNGKYGFINKNGEKIIPNIYDDVSYFKNGFALVRIGMYVGVIDVNGKIIVPIENTDITLNKNHIKAIKNNETAFFTLSGDLIFPYSDFHDSYTINMYGECFVYVNEDFMYGILDKNGEPTTDLIFNHIRFVEKENLFVVNKDGKYGLLDSDGKMILGTEFDDIELYDIEPEKDSYILFDSYGETIAQTDLSDLILSNEVTPKMKSYRDFLRKGTPNIQGDWYYVWACSDLTATVRLYKVDDYNYPVMYFYMEPIPVEQQGFPNSRSAFYSMENGEISEIIRGYECGGSIRGDFVQLYIDKNSEKSMLGTKGFWGGFGGHSNTYTVFLNESEQNEFYWINQERINFDYDDTYYLENTHLFYGAHDIPMPKKHILSAEYLKIFVINDKHVSKEDFENEVEKYLMLEMPLQNHY